MIDPIELGPARERHFGTDFAVQHALDQGSAFGGGLMLVDMGVGAVADEDVGELRGRVGDIGVQVVRHANGDIASDFFADQRQQSAFSVVMVFRHHRAVELQQDRVKRSFGFNGFQYVA